MMILLLSASTLASPPSLAVLDDIDRWEAGQRAFLEGPSGCWEIEGTARQVATLHQPPDRFSAARNQQWVTEGRFTATLVDGEWREVEHTVDGPDDLDLDGQFYPLFGTPAADPEHGEDDPQSVSVSVGSEPQISASVGSSVNLLTEAIDALSGSVETSLAQWDEDQQAALYLREVPVTDHDRRPVKVTVRFPDAGEHADRIDAVWPRLIKLGQWPVRIKIRDGQAHLVGHLHQDTVLPLAENLSLVVGVLGWTVGFEQSLTYTRATPCPVEPPTP